MNGVNTARLLGLTIAVARLSIAGAAAAFMVRDDSLSLLVSAAALLITMLPARVLATSPSTLAANTLAALLLAAHVVAGMLFGLYEYSAHYDKFMHLIGSAGLAALLIAMTREYLAQRRVLLPAGFVILLAFTGTLSAGAMWEIFEFSVDRTGLFTAQRSLHDTMIDLLADALGAMIALAAYAALTVTRAL